MKTTFKTIAFTILLLPPRLARIICAVLPMASQVPLSYLNSGSIDIQEYRFKVVVLIFVPPFVGNQLHFLVNFLMNPLTRASDFSSYPLRSKSKL
jgi:hypothetical protein